MNSRLTLKYAFVVLAFVMLALAEGVITNPPSSQKSLEYQQFYEGQASKGSLTQSEYEELKTKGDAFLNDLKNENQLGYLLTAKLLFSLLIFFTGFAACKYMFNKTTIMQVGFTLVACLGSLVLVVSTLELIVYMAFCITGTLIGKKYNKALKRDSAKNAAPLS